MPHLSRGNTKLGKVVNVSLDPDLTCGPHLPCFNDGCYARAIKCRNRLLGLQWTENTLTALNAPTVFFQYIRMYLEAFPVKHFRWHVGGDIPDQGYLTRMKQMAKDFPGTRFLCFTKTHDL